MPSWTPTPPEPVTDGGVTDAAGAPVTARPIALIAPWSVNQTLPSEPVQIPPGRLPAFKPAVYCVITCVVGLIVPIDGVVPLSPNQMLPSGPTAIRPRLAPAFMPLENSLIACVAGSIRPIALRACRCR